MTSIRNGDRCKDRISGFDGIVICVAEWLNGCERVLLAPNGVDKDGKVREDVWFDVHQVTVLQTGAFQAANAGAIAAGESPPPGGPQNDPTSAFEK